MKTEVEEKNLLLYYFKEKFAMLVTDVRNKTNSSRGKSLCLTKLDEAFFWIDKNIKGEDR